ncbi:hypothetical protein [Microbacterium sp. Se63.02b]|nr:hypothetical protein [Microbacterium sp. Se63.02b]QNA92366.1 hypothetical protein G4G29_08255 [Microbacterium sp. Se63.02b]
MSGSGGLGEERTAVVVDGRGEVLGVVFPASSSWVFCVRMSSIVGLAQSK